MLLLLKIRTFGIGMGAYTFLNFKLHICATGFLFSINIQTKQNNSKYSNHHKVSYLYNKYTHDELYLDHKKRVLICVVHIDVGSVHSTYDI